MTDILDLEECSGCRLYHGMYSEYQCLTRSYAPEKFVDCPCRICLVKVTCNIEVCETFIEFKKGHKKRYMDNLYSRHKWKVEGV
jgi:hypothetical protein